MGFCLAEMGFNLSIPKDPAAFAHVWPSLAAFALSFLFVSVLWWFHHKLFVSYSVLNPVTVFLNFVMLGSLTLAIYFQQVAAQFMIADVDPAIPVRYWMIGLAIVYAIVAIQYTIGIAYRRSTLSAQELRWGVNRAFRTAVVTVLMATFSLAFLAIGHLREATYAAVAAVVILGAARRILVPKITARLLAGRNA
jgi:uncharacterized membrane protein